MAGGYQYGTSPRKIQPEYTPSRRKNNKAEQKKQIERKVKENVKAKKKVQRRKRKIVLYVGIAFSVLLAISYRNSIINENFAKVKSLKSDLSAIEKENEQLQVSIESSLNLKNLEQAAKEKLGMQQLNNNQKIYINLPKKDYVEPAAEEVVINENQNWFEGLINKIIGK